MVYVLSHTGTPLMPTRDHRKVRLLLKEKLARVVTRTPFTVMLLHNTHEYKQPVTLGIDTGSKLIGLSASTPERELYAAEVSLRSDVTELLSTRRAFRRARRSRTTRYRAPRFDNRVHIKNKGWLAPSVENKIYRHIKCVEDIHKLLPVSSIVIEVASFDIQKIKAPDIEGKDYQQGDQLGFWNVREYVFWRDGHRCHGKKGCKNKILNVHHIESRKTGGDSPGNLITLCEECHRDFHMGKLKLELKRGPSFRDAAFMGIMRWAVYNRLKAMYPDVRLTYGYITKNTRITNGLEKSHRTDALCIAGHPGAMSSPEWYFQKAVRRHNRQLHRATIQKGGKRKANQAARYVFGYQLFDKVQLGEKEGFIFARRTSGSFDIRTLDGTKLSAGVSYKKLMLLESRKTLLTERRATSSPCLKTGVSVAI